MKLQSQQAINNKTKTFHKNYKINNQINIIIYMSAMNNDKRY
jgi:hypothetical protein